MYVQSKKTIKSLRRIRFFLRNLAWVGFFYEAFYQPNASAKACTDPDIWLKQHSKVADAIVWEMPLGAKPWKNWAFQDQLLLNKTIQKNCTDHNSIDSGLPELFQNQKKISDKDFSETVYSVADAKNLYFLSVAQSIAFDMKGFFKWNLAQYSPLELSLLFNSYNFFNW